LGPSDVEFTITNDRPIKSANQYGAQIDLLESLFNDIRLSNVINFKYLPPCNKFENGTSKSSDVKLFVPFYLGSYQPWGASEGLTYTQLKSELDYYKKLGFSKTISFDPTSTQNRLVCQIFEQTNSFLRKLDVIDFGIHPTGDQLEPTVHVFFAGRILVDSNDTHTFIHLFTLVFS
jgi:hypothetical protein